MEQTFFEDQNVTVTASRFIDGSQTYVVRNITSVDVAYIPPSRSIPIFLFLVGVVPIAIEHYASKELNNFITSTGSIISAYNWNLIGIAVVAFALLWLILQSNRYIIVLRTSGGEVEALESTKRKHIESVVSALNQSIISHA
jgi:hypothetical protein